MIYSRTFSLGESLTSARGGGKTQTEREEGRGKATAADLP